MNLPSFTVSVFFLFILNPNHPLPVFVLYFLNTPRTGSRPTYGTGAPFLANLLINFLDTQRLLNSTHYITKPVLIVAWNILKLSISPGYLFECRCDYFLKVLLSISNGIVNISHATINSLKLQSCYQSLTHP